jgi:signal transduction histidine kinase
VEAAIADADGLLVTFNALLRIARVEAGSGVTLTPVDLSAVLADAVELYEPLANERGQDLAAALAPGVTVPGDRDLLFQAAANLLDNAVKYTPEGGRIRVSLERFGNEAHVIVADNGPGIPAEERGKVFRHFYRVEASRSTPGNGLGLSLVAAIARLHRATIRLEDNAPGLRVVLHLPIGEVGEERDVS